MLFRSFIILYFLDRGLTFTQIGFLIAFREIVINLAEIPSGVLADLYGRRRSMIFSFSAYIVSFLLFGMCRQYWRFFIAMIFFAFGEAFRTVTHKALIFSWLRRQGRLDERNEIYGYTRSWSKLGSAASIVVATLLVFFIKNYSAVFYFSIFPYILGLINFMTYPKDLDQSVTSIKMQDVFRHLWAALKNALGSYSLRRLIYESMAFEVKYDASRFRISKYKMFMEKYPKIPLRLIFRKGKSNASDEENVTCESCGSAKVEKMLSTAAVAVKSGAADSVPSCGRETRCCGRGTPCDAPPCRE